MTDRLSAAAEHGSKSLSKTMSFKNEVKLKLTRKKSVGSGDKIDKNEKRKSFKRAGSFNNNRKKENHEIKTDSQRLEEGNKKICQAIGYVDDVINKGILDMLSGSISIVLEILIELEQIISSCFSKAEGEKIRSCHTQVLRHLTTLMKWSDDKLKLEDPSMAFNDRNEGREVVACLRNCVKELLLLACESSKSSTPTDSVTSTFIDSAPKSAGVLGSRYRTLDVDSPCSKPQQTSMNNALSYSADDILEDRRDLPPPKPPIPQQLVIPSLKLINGYISNTDDCDIIRNKGNLPPPIHARAGSHLSDSDNQSNAYLSNFRSSESMHRSPTNSVNSILSASSEEFLLDDPPPKPPRSPDQRLMIGQNSPSVQSAASLLTNGSSFIGSSKTSLVQKTLTTNFTSRSVTMTGENLQSLVKEMTSASFSVHSFNSVTSDSKSNTTVLSQALSSSSSSHFESLSAGKFSARSSLSSNRTSSASNDGVKKVEEETDKSEDNDSSQPPPLPPKQKPVEAYMSMFGSLAPFSQPSLTAANFSSVVVMRHSQHHHVYKQSADAPSSVNYAQDKFFQVDLYANSSRQNRESGTTASSHSSGLFSLETGSSVSGSGGDSTPPSLPPKTGSYKLSITPSSPIIDDSPTPEFSKNLLAPCQHEHTVESGGGDDDDDGDDVGSNGEPSIIDLTDASGYLVFKKPEEDGPDVRAGSVDALIVHATVSDFMFQEAFLMTYRTFLPPQQLVQKLVRRYNKFNKMTDNTRKKHSRNAFSLIVRVLDDVCIDTDYDVLDMVTSLVYQLACNGELKQAQKLRERCVTKLKSRQQRLCSAKTPLSSYQVTSKSHSVVDFKSEHIAQQMTLLDFQLFQKIDISEVLLWSRQQKEELSPNLTKFTEHFNRMSYWCRTRILEIEDPKDREKHLMKFIKIMKHLRQLNNFNSYLAILSALDSAPVRRLDWQKQNVEALKEFCQLIDSSSSFRAYRQALAETEPPCIPYIGLVLQDLTFIHIGNPDLDFEGRINFGKCWQLFSVINTMCRFKRSTKYNIKKNEKILSYFNNFDSYLSEDSLWQISEIIKPRPKKKSNKKDPS